MKSILWFLVFVPLAFAQRDYFNHPRHLFFEIGMGPQEIETRSPIFDYSEETLFFSTEDLDDVALTVNIQWQMNPFLAVGLGTLSYQGSVESEDRYYVFEDGSPIIQTTELDTLWYGLLVNWAPLGAMESFGTRAWGPKRLVPYFQFGIGFVDWEFSQFGDFVDYESEEVFFDHYLAEDVAFGARMGGGLRLQVSSRTSLFVHYNVVEAEDRLGGDFRGFGDLDLSSTSYQAGLRLLLF
jgi:hypothetical protein